MLLVIADSKERLECARSLNLLVFSHPAILLSLSFSTPPHGTLPNMRVREVLSTLPCTLLDWTPHPHPVHLLSVLPCVVAAVLACVTFQLDGISDLRDGECSTTCWLTARWLLEPVDQALFLFLLF